MTGMLKRLFLWTIAAGLILPFAVVFGVSINAESNIAFPPTEFSGRWYMMLLTQSDWLIPIGNSFTIAFLAALIASRKEILPSAPGLAISRSISPSNTLPP